MLLTIRFLANPNSTYDVTVVLASVLSVLRLHVTVLSSHIFYITEPVKQRDAERCQQRIKKVG